MIEIKPTRITEYLDSRIHFMMEQFLTDAP